MLIISCFQGLIWLQLIAYKWGKILTRQQLQRRRDGDGMETGWRRHGEGIDKGWRRLSDGDGMENGWRNIEKEWMTRDGSGLAKRWRRDGEGMETWEVEIETRGGDWMEMSWLRGNVTWMTFYILFLALATYRLYLKENKVKMCNIILIVFIFLSVLLFKWCTRFM